jgi:hypothetical protein
MLLTLAARPLTFVQVFRITSRCCIRPWPTYTQIATSSVYQFALLCSFSSREWIGPWRINRLPLSGCTGMQAQALTAALSRCRRV